jgi:hypothetical protein
LADLPKLQYKLKSGPGGERLGVGSGRRLVRCGLDPIVVKRGACLHLMALHTGRVP